MKKPYETPMVEKVEFNYEDQVVASSYGPCGDYKQLEHKNCLAPDFY